MPGFHVAAPFFVALALAPAAQARTTVLPKPTGSVSGTVQARWTEIVHAGARTSRTDAAITYTVEDRLRSRRAAETWVPQPQPPFVLDALRRNYAHLLRARVRVDHFQRTVDDVCPNGVTARATTLVTGLIQPHALLQTARDPKVDLARHTGRVVLRPVDVVFRASGEEDVPATGIVATRTTGTDCAGAVDTETHMHLGQLAGADVVESIIAAGDMSLRVTRGQGLVIDQPQPLLFLGLDSQTDTLTGSWTPDVRMAGPLRSQRARCRLPGRARMARVHDLATARRLLRRRGFPDVVFVPPAHGQARSFVLDAPSRYAFCGVTLGTHRHPVLRTGD